VKTIRTYKTWKLGMWFTPIIPAFGRLKQEDPEFKTSLDYIVILLSQK
jgi:hypothetical protein